MARVRAVLRGLGWLLLGVVALVALAVTAVLSPPGERWLAGIVQAQVGAMLCDGCRMDRPGLRVDLAPGRLALTDVAFHDADDTVILGVGLLDADLDLWALLDREVHLTRVRIDDVRVPMRTDADGWLNLALLFGADPDAAPEPEDPNAEPWGGLPVRIVVDDLHLSDGMVGLWGPAPEDGGDPSGFEARVWDLAADRVVLPAGNPGVRVDVEGLLLDGVLLAPGPLPLQLDGSGSWTGEGVLASPLSLRALGTGLSVEGAAQDLFGAGDLDVVTRWTPVDLSLVDTLFGAGTAGRYEGTLTAQGTFGGLGVHGSLSGVDGTRGALVMAKGSAVCLPGYPSDRDACGALPGVLTGRRLVGEDAALRWSAGLELAGFALEDVLPVVGGPLVLEGDLRARGGGTAWPDGVRVDEGSWSARDLDVFGFPIREVAVGVTLDRGVLGLEPLHLGAAGARLDGRGVLDLVRGDLEVDVDGPLVPAWLADIGLEGAQGAGTIGGTVRGRLFDDGVPIQVDAGLTVADFTWSELGIDRGHASAEVAIVDGAVEVAGALALSDVSAWGAHLPRVVSDDLSVRVADGDTRVTLSVDAGEVWHDLGLWADAVAAEVAVGVPADDPLTVDVQVGLGDHALYGLEGERGRVRLGMQGDVLGLDVALHHDAGVWLGLDGFRYDMADGVIDARRVQLAPKPGVAEAPAIRWVSSRPLHVQLPAEGEQGLPAFDVALRDEAGGGLDLVGALPFEGPLSLDARLDALPVSLFDDVFPAASIGLEGAIDLVAVASGSADDPIAQLDVALTGLVVPDIADGLGAKGTIGIAHDVASVDLAIGSADEPDMLALMGTLPVHASLLEPGVRPAGAVDLRAELAAGTWARISQTLPVVGALPGGRSSAVLRVSGDLQDPDLDLEAIGDLRVAGLSGPGRLEVDLKRNAGQLVVHADLFEGLAPRVRVDGTAATRLGEVMAWLLDGGPEPGFDDLSLYADDLDVTARLMDVPAQTIVSLADVQLPVRGPLAGDITIGGSPRRPLVDASLNADWTLDDDPFDVQLCLRRPAEAGAAPTIASGPATPRAGAAVGWRAVPRTGRLRSALGRAAVDTCEGKVGDHDDPETYGVWLQLGDDMFPWLTAKGRIPVAVDLMNPPDTWGTTTFDIDVEGLGIPLAILAAVDPEVHGEAGAVLVQGHLGGTLLDPRPSISLEVLEGILSHRGIGVRARELVVRGHMEPEADGGFGALQLVLDELRFSTQPLQQSVETVLAGGSGAKRGPSVQGGARVHLDAWSLAEVEAQLSMHDAWLMATELNRLRVGGEVAVEGRYPALDIDGRLAVSSGLITVNTADLLASRSTHVDPRITICRPGLDLAVCAEAEGGEPVVPEEAAEDAAEDDEPTLAEAMTVSVDLDLGRNVQADVTIPVLDSLGGFGATLTQADIEARVGGALDVGYRKGRLSLVGDVEMYSGRVGVLRSRFEIDDSSTVTFLGEDYANPQLSIAGSMGVAGGSIRLKLLGTPSAPELELTSEEFGSDAELFTILLTGKAPDELTSQEGLAAAQALGDLLLNSLLGGVNLGSVSVQADGTIRLGVPVARTVFLESVFDPSPELNDNRIQVGAEWSVLPQVLIEASYGDRIVDGGVSWEVRFDGPGRAKAAARRATTEDVGKTSAARVQGAVGVSGVRKASGGATPASEDAPSPDDAEEPPSEEGVDTDSGSESKPEADPDVNAGVESEAEAAEPPDTD